jgi:DNA-binding CsgD family transcriptional regulator
MPNTGDTGELRVRLDGLLPSERAILEAILVSSMERRQEDARSALLEVELTPAAEAVLRKPPYGLTRREIAVLKLLFEDNTNKETALVLGLSPRTVETHRGHIQEKLGTRTPIGLTKLVMGIISAAGGNALGKADA